MFDLKKMLNTLFGKDLIVNADGSTYSFDLNLFLNNIFGEVKLANKPNYELAGKRKSLSLVNGEGDVDLRISSYLLDNNKMIEIICANTLNSYEFLIDIIPVDGKITLFASGKEDFFILKDNVVSYLSKDSIMAYTVLSGNKPSADHCDFENYAIKADDSIELNENDENFENIVGNFIKKNLFELNKKPNYSLNDLANSMSNGFTPNGCDSFNLSDYFNELYSGLVLPLSDGGPGFKNEVTEEAEVKTLRIKGDGASGLDFITVTATNSLVNSENNIDIFTINMNNKIYTTFNITDGQFSFFSKILSNSDKEDMMDCSTCEIIVGDNKGMKFYNKDSIDAYAKLKDLAFKMELDGQQSFENYFVYPDDEVLYDSEMSISSQLGRFVQKHFYSKTEKVDNKLILKKSE